MYPGRIENLRVYALSPEQAARTCGPYPFVCQHQGMAFTAFLSVADRDEWLRMRGLTLDGTTVAGAYAERMHWSYDEFYALTGDRIRVMSNGDFTLGIVTTDAEGMRTVHTLNPNCRERPVFPHSESRAMQKLGDHSAPAPRGW